MKRQRQISVPLSPVLETFVSQTAAQEGRTVAGLIRHLIAEAAWRGTGEQRQAT
jgi:hypothetical protein